MKLNAVVVGLLVLSSCQSNESGKMALPEREYAVQLAEASSAEDQTRKANSNGPKKASSINAERKLIKSGSISFETDDIEKTKKEIAKIYTSFKGYVASETGGSYGDRLQYEQQIRVPATNFDRFILSIEQLGRLESKNIITQDITEEFVDVEARLKTKKELENRYRELLQIAKTVEDMLSIENQIANIRSDIESMEGRLNFLKNQVSYSTITISYYEVTGSQFGFSGKFALGLKEGWRNLLTFFVAVSSVWPFLILVAGGTYFVFKHRRRALPGT